MGVFLRFLLLFVSLTALLKPGHSQEDDFGEMYDINGTDTVLKKDFIEKICQAARNKTGEEQYHTELEKLVSTAALTSPGAPEQQQNVAEWWKNYGISCQCPATKKFPEGNFLRQTFHSDFRLFSNIVGPEGRLSIDLDLLDPSDGLTLLEYINRYREKIEEKYDHNRKKFQKDKEWQAFIFFFMLYSEYRIK